MRRENVLVLGGTGLVGSSLVRLLLEKYQVPAECITVFDLKRPTTWDPTKGIFAGVSLILGDLTRMDQVLEACRNQDVVYHTISPPHGLGASVYFKVNVEGTRNVINACKENKVAKLIFTSSASVVYYGQHLLNAGEDLPYCEKHIDAYNESKAMAEQLVLEANDPKNGFYTAALRPAGIFGPGDMQASYGIYQAAKSGKHKYLIGDNTTLFDMTYVENCAYAHILAAEKLDESSAGQVYNVTNDSPVFWFDFAKAIYEGLGYRPSLHIRIPAMVAYFLAYLTEFLLLFINPLLSKKIEPTITVFRMKFILCNRVYNVDKAKNVLGYKPIVPMEQAIENTIRWLKQLDNPE